MDGAIMESRNILDKDGNIIGMLELPDGTSEEIWAEKLAEYTKTIPIQEKIKASVKSAKDFANQLIIDFATENIMLGITQDGKTGIVLQKLTSVLFAMITGSLYEAITRVKEIPESDYDDKYITAARLLIFVNKIEAYLNVPLSTEL